MLKGKIKVLLGIALISSSTLYGCVNPSTTSPSSSATTSPQYADSAKEQSGSSSQNLFAPSVSASPSASASASAYPMPSASASATNTTQPGQTGGTSDIKIMPSAQPSPEEPKTVDNTFKNYDINPFVSTATDKFSTFASDVDTASYTWMRKSLNNNIMVSPDSVRVEEYINYFDYNYKQPETGKFTINTDLVNSRVEGDSIKTLRVGVQGKEIKINERKDSILTFVIDVSGSMNQENRLGLVKESLEVLLRQLKPGDKVGIVVYGSTARVVLEHKSISQEGEIIDAIRKLSPEGSTNTEAGLRLGYQQAEKYFKAGAINRVILCSDGVANVGATGPEAILEKIKQESESGINLSTVGFGMGNYNDTLMEQLADKGDGNYAYVDTLDEADRIFRENLTGTLQVIAKDVKVQLEFDPTVVKEYRLLGYENRDVADTDFRNDAKDAGEIGSNHSVTAIYELKMQPEAKTGTVATVYLRYKDVDNLNTVLEMNQKVNLSELVNFSNSSASFRLSKTVAEYAEILRESPYVKDITLDNVLNLAKTVNTDLNKPEKVTEFVSLVEKAKLLKK